MSFAQILFLRSCLACFCDVIDTPMIWKKKKQWLLFKRVLFIITFLALWLMRHKGDEELPIKTSVGAYVTNSGSYAYVTFLHSNHEDMVKSAKILVYSLKEKNKTLFDVVVMIVPAISVEVRVSLMRLGAKLILVPSISSPLPKCSNYSYGLFKFNEEDSTPLGKINAWALQDWYTKVVYIDVDILVVSDSLDHMFELSEELIGYPMTILPDWFSTKLMVISPSQAKYQEMIKALALIGNADCTEDSFLNTFFSHWSTAPKYHLPKGVFYDKLPLQMGNKRFTTGILQRYESVCYMISLENGAWPYSNIKEIKERVVNLSEKVEIFRGDASLANPKILKLNVTSTKWKTRQISAVASLRDDRTHHRNNKNAYVIFIQNNHKDFITSALVMAQTLLTKTHHKYPIVAMATPFVSDNTRKRLKYAGLIIRDIDSMQHPIPNCAKSKWNSKDGNSEIAKLRVWELEEYDKVVYLDVDLLILDDINELFEVPGTPVSAARGM